jgi:2-polyprenyl-3-methyl-5-hydroxy-6-metoxy-1,4-benzoquinol methylase
MSIKIEKSDKDADELDLTQLMDQIRHDAEKRKRDAFNSDAPVFYQQLITEGFDSLLLQSNSLPDALKLQPQFERRARYQLNDLLCFHDDVFVRNAYRAILKREPDDVGFAQYLRELRSGRFSKIDVLSSIRFSPEGRKANVTIDGLGKLSILRKSYRVPVVGYLLRLSVAILRLPVLITNYRQLDSHTAAQLDRVAGHVNEVVAHLTAESREQVEINRTQFGTVQKQLVDFQKHLIELRNSMRFQINALEENQDTLKQSQNALRLDLFSRLKQTTDQVQGWERQAAELEALKQQLEQQIEGLMEHVQKAKMEIAHRETLLSHRLDDAEKSQDDLVGRDKAALKNEDEHLLDSFYFSLEEALRGTPEQIKEEAKGYLPLLEKAGITADIIDIGCGRGEWLEVLRESGFRARGIDQNHIAVEHCRGLSLDVVASEARAYLRSLSDESVSAITAFHFAEHLPLEALVSFLDQAGRTLKPGGLLILETPNPENLLVGSCNFYLDPTHKNPIPIPTMTLLLESRGFCCQEVLKLHPVPSVQIEVKDQLTSHMNHYLYGPMNYAVVARKPGIDLPKDKQ